MSVRTDSDDIRTFPSKSGLDRPAFRRHLRTIIYGNRRGPYEQKREAKRTRAIEPASTCEAVAREWFTIQKNGWTEVNAATVHVSIPRTHSGGRVVPETRIARICCIRPLIRARSRLVPCSAATTHARLCHTTPTGLAASPPRHCINPVLTCGIRLAFAPVTANVPVGDAPAGSASRLPSPSRFASTTI